MKINEDALTRVLSDAIALNDTNGIAIWAPIEHIACVPFEGRSFRSCSDTG